MDETPGACGDGWLVCKVDNLLEIIGSYRVAHKARPSGWREGVCEWRRWTELVVESVKVV